MMIKEFATCYTEKILVWKTNKGGLKHKKFMPKTMSVNLSNQIDH